MIDWFTFIFANSSLRGIQMNPQGSSVSQPVTETCKQHLGVSGSGRELKIGGREGWREEGHANGFSSLRIEI